MKQVSTIKFARIQHLALLDTQMLQISLNFSMIIKKKIKKSDETMNDFNEEGEKYSFTK